MWGLLATGIFAQKDVISEGFSFNDYDGLLYGDSYLLGVQALAALTFAAWAVISTFIIIRTIDFILPLRAGSVFHHHRRELKLLPNPQTW